MGEERYLAPTALAPDRFADQDRGTALRGARDCPDPRRDDAEGGFPVRETEFVAEPGRSCRLVWPSGVAGALFGN